MKISDMKESDFLRFFESRLTENRLRKSGRGYMALCCFHHEQNPSLSINMERGVFKCHAGCGEGGLIEFECKFSSCDKQTALKNIAEIVGQPQLSLAIGKGPDHIFSYQDAN